MQSLELQVVPIEEDGFHLHISAEINGIRANLLLDTGASRTVFDKERILSFASDLVAMSVEEKRSTGLGTNTMEIFMGKIGSLEVAGIRLSEFDAALLDLSHVNESYRLLGVKEIDGVLGTDFLIRHNAVIDLPELILRFNSGPADDEL